MPFESLPDWQLPRGVDRALWDYARTDAIGEQYDSYFAGNPLFAADEAALLAEFTRPGVLVDLGCGSGRLVLAFARRGFHAIGLDLSAAMLRELGKKAAAEKLDVGRVQANMVELESLRDGSCDYVICMFNSLGMVRGAAHRQQALHHAARLLRPGGRLALHTHNRWFHLWLPGRSWLFKTTLQSWLGGAVEPGDRTADYRGIPNVCLHAFSRGETRALLRAAGLPIDREMPFKPDGSPLPLPGWCSGLRAHGWIFFTTRPGGAVG